MIRVPKRRGNTYIELSRYTMQANGQRPQFKPNWHCILHIHMYDVQQRQSVFKQFLSALLRPRKLS